MEQISFQEILQNSQVKTGNIQKEIFNKKYGWQFECVNGIQDFCKISKKKRNTCRIQIFFSIFHENFKYFFLNIVLFHFLRFFF